MINLDLLCMETAQAMATISDDRNEKENLATKALGVLLENGPYGMILYLESQKKDIARKYTDYLIDLCSKAKLSNDIPEIPSVHDFLKITAWLQRAAVDLDTYLFIKRLWQQALTYARYHCKAADGLSSTASE